MNVRPLSDNILVCRAAEETTSSGGIILTEKDKEKPMRGEVIAVGRGKKQDGKVVPLDLKVGDKIIFGKYSGTEVKIDDKELLMMKESDVMAIIE